MSGCRAAGKDGDGEVEVTSVIFNAEAQRSRGGKGIRFIEHVERIEIY